MKLILIHGLPGVGKLTVGRQVAKLTRYRLFHIHGVADMIESVFDFGSDAFIELRDMTWMSVVRRSLDEDFPGLVATFPFEKSVKDGYFDDLVDDLESRGGEALFAELTCAHSELERRLVSPSRKRYRKLKSVRVLNQLMSDGVFRTPELPKASLVIDTTLLSPIETAQKIVSFL